ncbi:hypothetical protein Z968_12600, partial [Clostridium novyi A str. 4552]
LVGDKMKKMYKGLVLKIMILTSIFFICTFMIKSYKYVYAAPLSSEEIMQKEIDDLKKENKELGEKYSELDKEAYKIKTIASIVITILLGGSSISIYKMYEIKKEIGKKVQKEVNKKVIKEVNKKVPQQVAKRVGEETERVKLMIDNLKKDEKLMCETKMIVISYNDEEEEEAKSLLKQFKKHNL